MNLIFSKYFLYFVSNNNRRSLSIIEVYDINKQLCKDDLSNVKKASDAINIMSFNFLIYDMYYYKLICMQIDGSITTYADDTCTLFSGNSWELVLRKENIELNRLILEIHF